MSDLERVWGELKEQCQGCQTFPGFHLRCTALLVLADIYEENGEIVIAAGLRVMDKGRRRPCRESNGDRWGWIASESLFVSHTYRSSVAYRLLVNCMAYARLNENGFVFFPSLQEAVLYMASQMGEEALAKERVG